MDFLSHADLSTILLAVRELYAETNLDVLRETMVRLATESEDGNLSLIVTRETNELEVSPEQFPQLTRRECEVLAWIARGKSNPEIATILTHSVRTVYKHVENIFAKLGVESRAAAMLRALEGNG